MDVVDLEQKLSLIHETWSPRIVAELNGQHVKLAKLEGAFDWHAHAEEDELFLVLAGRLEMQLRDGVRVLEKGQMCVVPRGVEHRPVAEQPCHVLLFEPVTTVNTGDSPSERTVADPEWI